MLSPQLPDLADLDALLVIARTGSMTAAAGEIGLTQQALSLRVRAMEGRLGFAVFVRTTRGSRLTDAGLVVAEWAAKLVEAAAQFDVGLAALRGDRQAHLHVAASLTVAEHLLPGWLVALRARQVRAGLRPSAVDLEATNSDTVVRRVLEGAADIGFVEGPKPPTSVRSRIVGRDELVVVVRPTHPWAARRRGVSVRELASTPLVSRESGSGTRSAFEAAVLAASAAGISLARPILALSNAAAVRAAVVAGAGPAVMSSFAIADDVALGRLCVVKVPLELRRSLRAVWIGSAEPPGGVVRDLIGIATRGQSRRDASRALGDGRAPQHRAGLSERPSAHHARP